MAYLLFFAYLLLLLVLIPRIRLFKNSGMHLRHLQVLFLVKVAAGVLYGFLYARWGGGDTWFYFAEGLREEALLRADPITFITSMAEPGYDTGYGAFFGTEASWRNDLDGHFFGKTQALLNLLSGSNYYINSIFFNLLSFTGTVLLYRTWKQVLPHARWWVHLAPFLVPSFLFWSSGIHKEGVLVLAFGLIMYHTAAAMAQRRLLLKNVAAVCLGFALVLIHRNFLLLPLAVALLGWLLAHQAGRQVHPLVLYFSALLWVTLAFFGTRYLVPALDFPQVVVARQAAFNSLEGNSRLHPLPLQPTAASFIRWAPAAFFRGGFQPLPPVVHHLLTGLAALESMLVLLVLMVSLRWLPRSSWRQPFLLCCLFLAAGVMLAAGYTVVFPGAIARYRSPVLPLALMPSLAMMVRWGKMGRWTGVKIGERF